MQCYVIEIEKKKAAASEQFAKKNETNFLKMRLFSHFYAELSSSPLLSVKLKVRFLSPHSHNTTTTLARLRKKSCVQLHRRRRRNFGLLLPDDGFRLNQGDIYRQQNCYSYSGVVKQARLYSLFLRTTQV